MATREINCKDHSIFTIDGTQVKGLKAITIDAPRGVQFEFNNIQAMSTFRRAFGNCSDVKPVAGVENNICVAAPASHVKPQQFATTLANIITFPDAAFDKQVKDAIEHLDAPLKAPAHNPGRDQYVLREGEDFKEIGGFARIVRNPDASLNGESAKSEKDKYVLTKGEDSKPIGGFARIVRNPDALLNEELAKSDDRDKYVLREGENEKPIGGNSKIIR